MKKINKSFLLCATLLASVSIAQAVSADEAASNQAETSQLVAGQISSTEQGDHQVTAADQNISENERLNQPTPSAEESSEENPSQASPSEIPQQPAGDSTNDSGTDSKASAEGTEQAVATSVEEGQASVTLSAIDQEKGRFDVVVSETNSSKTIEHVDVAIWSQENDQDDLRWYSSSQVREGKVVLNFDIANHHNQAGLYHIHAYTTFMDGSRQGTNAGSVMIHQAKPTIAVTADAFLVDFKRPAPDKGRYKVAVWSKDKEQDDLIWYDTDKAGKLTVPFSHHSGYGSYLIHSYLNMGNRMIGLDASLIERPKPKEIAIKIEGDNILVDFGHGAPKGASLAAAIWSENKGQDDLVWYTADKTGQIKAPLKNHRDYGNYNVHAYLFDSGKPYAISGRQIEVTKPKMSSVNITKKSDSHYSLEITGVSETIQSLLVPIWSEEKGQDDLIWYPAAKKGDDLYKLELSLARHNYATGTYNIHVYGKDYRNQIVGLGTRTLTVTSIKEVTNLNQDKGTFDVIISQRDDQRKVVSIAVAVWSQDKQENIYWYKTDKVNDGSLAITADIRNHKNVSGDYHIHAYLTDDKGETHGYVLPSQTLKAVAQALPSKADIRLSGFYNVRLTDQQAAALTYALPTDKTLKEGYAGNRYGKGYSPWYVYNRAVQTGHSISASLGNASEWVDRAKAQGYSVGTNPRVGSAACFSPGVAGASANGQVAFVEHVNSDGSFLISEMVNQNVFNWRLVTPQSGVRFIYL